MSEEFDSLKKRKNQNSKTQHRLKADNSKLNIQNSTFLYSLHVFQNHLLCVK